MQSPIELPSMATLLALIPSIIGERPEDRIVVVLLGGSGTLEAYSHALPWRGDHRTTKRVAKDLAEAAVEHGGTDSILIAVFCRSVAGAGDRPYEQLQSLVTEAAHRYNIHLAESFYVASNGWGSFCCDDPRCEYSGPRPLSELQEYARSVGTEF